MDRDTLRAFVLEHKNKGMSYQDISNKLKEDLNITRSRQALQGIYTRAINRIDSEKIVVDSHIFNLAALGYNSTEITKLMKQLGHKVVYRYVTNNVKNNKLAIDSNISSYSKKIIAHRNDLMTVNDVQDIVEYRGIKANENGINNIIKDAYIRLVKEESIKIIREAYQLTDNRKVIREMINEIDLDLKISDIEKNMI